MAHVTDLGMGQGWECAPTPGTARASGGSPGACSSLEPASSPPPLARTPSCFRHIHRLAEHWGPSTLGRSPGEHRLSAHSGLFHIYHETLYALARLYNQHGEHFLYPVCVHLRIQVHRLRVRRSLTFYWTKVRKLRMSQDVTHWSSASVLGKICPECNPQI